MRGFLICIITIPPITAVTRDIGNINLYANWKLVIKGRIFQTRSDNGNSRKKRIADVRRRRISGFTKFSFTFPDNNKKIEMKSNVS